MKSSSLHTSCLVFIPSNAHIVDIEKPHGISSSTFGADTFIRLFLHPSLF